MSIILDRARARGRDKLVASVLYALSTYHHLRSNREQAMSFAEEGVAHYERGLEKHDKAEVTAWGLAALSMRAQCHIMVGRYPEALKDAERAVALHDREAHRPRVDGLDHPSVRRLGRDGHGRRRQHAPGAVQ